jgi:hypothetical protein
MPNIHTWFIGINFTLVITPQVVATNGGLSNSGVGSLSLVGRLDDSGTDQQTSFETENISPMDCPWSNPVPLEQGSSFSITEILDSYSVAAGGGNQLLVAALTSSYHKLQIFMKDRAGSSILVGTAYCLMTGWNPNFRKGKCVGLMNLHTVALPAGAGSYTANPAYT